MRDIGFRPQGEHPNPAHWSTVRVAALRRDHGCRACGQSSGLEVHHRSYDRWGKELLDDVTVLCVDCHRLFTEHQLTRRGWTKPLPSRRNRRKDEAAAVRYLIPRLDIRPRGTRR